MYIDIESKQEVIEFSIMVIENQLLLTIPENRVVRIKDKIAGITIITLLIAFLFSSDNFEVAFLIGNFINIVRINMTKATPKISNEKLLIKSNNSILISLNKFLCLTQTLLICECKVVMIKVNNQFIISHK